MKKAEHQDGLRRALIRNTERQRGQLVVEPRRWKRPAAVCACEGKVSTNCPVKYHQERARRQRSLQWD